MLVTKWRTVYRRARREKGRPVRSLLGVFTQGLGLGQGGDGIGGENVKLQDALAPLAKSLYCWA